MFASGCCGLNVPVLFGGGGREHQTDYSGGLDTKRLRTTDSLLTLSEHIFVLPAVGLVAINSALHTLHALPVCFYVFITIPLSFEAVFLSLPGVDHYLRDLACCYLCL